jgi:hypothetical protein
MNQCIRRTCGIEFDHEPTVSKRSDSIVRGEVFCSVKCKNYEAEYRKQKIRRAKGLDTISRRRRDFRKKYGITLEDWDKMYTDQTGKCAICDVSFDGLKVCVDHDHKTGAVRGLLCVECNHGLGKFKDDSSVLFAAATYLLREPLHTGVSTRLGVMSE